MYANLKNLLLLKRLNGNLSKTRAELENIQRKKLISLIHHAYENTRYYRDLFDSTSLRPSDIRSVEDLSMLPTTGKLKLQSLDPEDILTHDISRDRYSRHYPRSGLRGSGACEL